MHRFEDAVEAQERVRDAQTGASSATGAKRFVRADSTSEPFGGDALGLGALPSPLRMAMSLIARRAGGPDAALEPVIDLLVEGDSAKRGAIVNAFRTNEPLREQWLRTYEILRG